MKQISDKTYELLKKDIERLEGKSDEWNKGDVIWIVDNQGRIFDYRYLENRYLKTDKLQQFYIKHGQAFHTEYEAKMKVLRMQAGAKRWKPEEGEYYWYWNFEVELSHHYVWDFSSYQIVDYWAGNTHKTEKESNEWGKEYGKAFKI